MKLHRRLGLVIAMGLATAVAAAFFALRPSEPAYQGKKLSEWLKILGNSTGEVQEQAKVAIREIGTNALPTLLEMLRTKDSWLQIKLIQLGSKQSLVKFNFTPQEERRFLAMISIQILGPAARPPMPVLIELLNQADTTDHARIMLSPLAGKGLEPKDVLLLARSFSNQNPAVRVNVLNLLSSDRGVVVNALGPCLRNKDPADRITAIDLLVRLGEIRTIPQRDGEKSAIVHILMKALQDTSPDVRVAAVRALGRFGTDAQEAMPSLLKHVDDPDGGVRTAVSVALMRIGPGPPAQVDPDAAANVDLR